MNEGDHELYIENNPEVATEELISEGEPMLDAVIIEDNISSSSLADNIDTAVVRERQQAPLSLPTTIGQMWQSDSGYDYPFEFVVINNDAATASLVCYMFVDEIYEVLLTKSGTEEYYIITDDSPFSINLNEQYTVCIRFLNNGTLYYYDGHMSVRMSQLP